MRTVSAGCTSYSSSRSRIIPDIAVAEILELPLSHKPSDKYYAKQLQPMTTRQVGMKKDEESVEEYLDYLVSDSKKIHQVRRPNFCNA